MAEDTAHTEEAEEEALEDIHAVHHEDIPEVQDVIAEDVIILQEEEVQEMTEDLQVHQVHVDHHAAEEVRIHYSLYLYLKEETIYLQLYRIFSR